MNRIIYFLMCAIAVCSCTKEVETTQPIAEGEPMQFSVGSISKLDTKVKFQYKDGSTPADVLAIYADRDFEEPDYDNDGYKLYEYNKDGTLTPKDPNDCWKYSFDNDRYRAYFPANMGPGNSTTFSDVDIVSAELNAENHVGTFMFEHDYAIVSLTFVNSTGLTLDDAVVEVDVAGTIKTFNDVDLTKPKPLEFFICEFDYGQDGVRFKITLTANGYEFPITLATLDLVGGTKYEQKVTLQKN